ncbi:MAG TPA: DUF423 domain-containing protein [Longimicrobiales bacterium]|nr:DUF423 domain-containing protein [Longimicrobiales bacterium]
MDRNFAVLGALFALVSVAMGAFGAHVLTGRIPPERLETLDLATRYQMYHALALLFTAWASSRWPGAATTTAGWFFLAGIFLFCGTLYALVFGAPRGVAMLAPFGGTSFMIGWLLLAWAAWRG